MKKIPKNKQASEGAERRQGASLLLAGIVRSALRYRNMVDNISRKLHSDETEKKAAETIVETVEAEKLNAQKDSIEGSIRDHLRGFSRTIPAFLMAYGDENTTLANFDALVPDEVFWEVTVNPQNGQGVTLDRFRMLRDGGDYVLESGGRNTSTATCLTRSCSMMQCRSL